MPLFDLVVRSQRTATPAGVVPAALGISGGRIRAVDGYGAGVRGREETDLGTVALLPGCVDLDIAAWEPGRSLREGYARTAAAALRGGVTTVVAAPAPARPAITEVAALRAHMDAASGTSLNVTFLGGLTDRSSPAGLAALRAAGVVAFQCSLSDGGAPDIAAVDDAGLRAAMAELARIDAPLLVHTEDAGELAAEGDGGFSAPPARAERRGAERVVAAARRTGARAHVSPFGAAECAALLSSARSLGITVGAHTCPHYLCLSAEQVSADSAAFRCRPPLRSAANRAALWSALLDSDPVITTVGSGHRPGTGVSTISWTLASLWTAAARRGCGLADLARWTSSSPAGVLGLPSKGTIAVGSDADLVAFCPDSQCMVPTDDDGPYAGRRLTGRVLRTWVSGRAVFSVPADPAVREGRDRSAAR